MHLNGISIFWENHDFPVICTQQCLLMSCHTMPYIIYTILYLYLFAGHKPIHIQKKNLSVGDRPCELEMERQLPKGSNHLAHWHAKAAITLHGISLVISWEISLWNNNGTYRDITNQPDMIFMKFMQSRSKNQRLKQDFFQPAERISQIPPIASHLVFISDPETNDWFG